MFHFVVQPVRKDGTEAVDTAYYWSEGDRIFVDFWESIKNGESVFKFKAPLEICGFRC